ncbi:MAG: formamidopyrimidine-DNA glycosylase [Actinomycetota bacterium]|nr:formamidopyrimidine-DNA glycosylase [Actinomycetota bacterium]
MPELLEVEAYRQLAEEALKRPIAAVGTPDTWYLKRGLEAGDLVVMVGGQFVAARRRGKLLLLDTEMPEGGAGPVLGLRFGMTGRLAVDGRAGVGQLLYSSDHLLAKYERLRVTFADQGHLVVSDVRRLGGVELDPDEGRLGYDAASVTEEELAQALSGSRSPLKARVMDQVHLAGLGNLSADEVLWRAGLSPFRPAASLAGAETRRLHHHLRASLADMAERGGSHTGDLMPERVAGGKCPRDGHLLRHDKIGGRTTWWCPAHQH